MSSTAVTNVLKVKIPKVKDGTDIIKIKLINSERANDVITYDIEVESGYCIRMRREGEDSGFSFSPRTEDPIVFKDSHLVATTSCEHDEVYVNLMAPDIYYICFAEELQPA